jgi:nucleotide-binding universal stress UspA family protein
MAHLTAAFGATLFAYRLHAMPDRDFNRWAQPKVILVATDLSDLERLIPFAFQQAQQTDARIVLLHAPGAATSITADPTGMPHYDPSGVIDFAIKTLEPWIARARAQKISCDAVVREGQPAPQIIAAARQFNADRLLLGTRSRSKVGKLLLGSVAEQVLRSVNLPVITVGPEAHLEADNDPRQRVVLHATTLRETSRPSAALACQIAASLKAKLVLLHVLPPVDEMRREHLLTGLDSTSMRDLRILAAEINTANSCWAAVEARVAHGHPAIEILAASVDLRAELIVLGSTHRSFLHSLTHNRTVYRVLAHARCPVMTLRDAAQETVASTQAHDAMKL